MKKLIEYQAVVDVVNSEPINGWVKDDLVGALQSLQAVDLKAGYWIKMSGYCTPGGDPVWCCSECGKGVHVYGTETSTYGKDIADHQWVTCPNCGAVMI